MVHEQTEYVTKDLRASTQTHYLTDLNYSNIHLDNALIVMPITLHWIILYLAG